LNTIKRPDGIGIGITAVISFCSNDWRFLKACIEGVRPFSEQIVITVCDHFFDGSLENYALLEEAYRLFPDCLFIEFAFDPHESYRLFSPLYPEHPDWRHEWHNTGRWIASYFAPPSSEYLLFVDTDEIIDAPRFITWLDQSEFHHYSAIRFAGYWHFRSAENEALTHADLSLLVKRGEWPSSLLWDEDERLGFAHKLPGEKRFREMGMDGKPLIRHYSWVRPKEEMKRKCALWGHHWERPWENLVDEEFSHAFQGTDFIRGYHYHATSLFFDPLQVEIPLLNHISREEHVKNLQRFKNAIMVNKNQMQKREQYEYWNHH
jgi:hypothetical protein